MRHGAQAAPEGAPPGDRFPKVVAVCIVVATLIGAGVALLQGEASRTGSRADADAQRYAAESLTELSRAGVDTRTQYELFLQRRLQLRRLWSLRGQRLFGVGGDRRELRRQEAHWSRLAERTQRTSQRLASGGRALAIAAGNEVSPERDEGFPGQFLGRSQERSQELDGLREAANHEGAERGDQQSSYVVMLAILAVAVYLLGFSLTPQGRDNRLLFSIVGVGFTLVALVWALVVSGSAGGRPDPAAATALAKARTAYASRRLNEAVSHYDRAIDLWPDFGRAYAERGTAIQFAGSPQLSTIVNLTEREALERAIADHRRALGLGVRDGLLLNNLGYALVQLGIRTGSNGRVDAGIGYLRRAQEAVPDNPLSALNIALGHLAVGRTELARDAYADALRQLATRKPVEQVPYVASALTGLELALEHDASLAGPVRDAKERIVGYGLEPAATSGGGAPTAGIDLAVTPVWVQARVHLTGLDPSRDHLALYWYRREEDLGWSVLEQVSSPVLPAEAGVGPDGVTVRRLYRSLPGRCLPTGRYRVEAYVGGHLAGGAEIDAQFARLQVQRDYDMPYSLCRRSDWARVPNRSPGLIDGWVAPDGARGVYVLRLPAIGSEVGVFDPAERARRGLDAATAAMRARFPSPPVLDRQLEGVTFAAGVSAGLTGEGVRYYAYEGGRILAGYGTDPTGAVLVGMVFGPDAYFEGLEPLVIFDSIIPL